MQELEIKEEDNIKFCKKCNQFKSIDLFSKSSKLRCCKECLNKDYIKYNRKKGVKERKKTYPIIDGKRVCNTCKINKPLEDFYFRKDANTYRGECINCHINNKHTYRKEHYEKARKSNQNSYYKHCEERKSHQRLYTYNNIDIIKQRRKNQYKEKINDPFLKLRWSVSKIICNALKKQCSTKNGSCMDYFDYSIEELKQHLESQFESWMNWNNHGTYRVEKWNDNDSSTWTWQIDHIIPQSSLPYDSMDHPNFKKCWALENLRPLSAKENLIKGNRILNIEEK